MVQQTINDRERVCAFCNRKLGLQVRTADRQVRVCDNVIRLDCTQTVDADADEAPPAEQTAAGGAARGGTVTYGIDDTPPWYLCIFMALQVNIRAECNIDNHPEGISCWTLHLSYVHFQVERF